MQFEYAFDKSIVSVTPASAYDGRRPLSMDEMVVASHEATTLLPEWEEEMDNQ
jgi:hypothetical protein